jgi:serine/threonine protein kinase
MKSETSPVPTIEGYLDRKKGLGFKSKKYCKLVQNQLQIFKRERDKNPESVLNLLCDWSIEIVDSSHFRIAEPRKGKISFSASSTEKMMRWVLEIRRAAFASPKISLSMFDILSVLGRGSFGKILLSRSKLTREVFAIKAIPKTRLLSDTKIKFVLAERNVLQKVSHPFIISLKFAFQSSRKFYLGLEYAPGGDLYARMKKSGTVSPDDIRFYIAEVATAINALHHVGVIYRDLKPENILFDAEGHVKLTDFGLAIEVDMDGTATGFCGTTEYLSPELVSRNPYTYSVDWWGLGILAYELYYGYSPFKVSGQTRPQVYKNIVENQPRFEPGTSPEFVSFVKMLLDKDPLKRGGFEQVRDSDFMKGINWNAVLTRQLIPPQIPVIDRSVLGLGETCPSIEIDTSSGIPSHDLCGSVSGFSCGELICPSFDSDSEWPHENAFAI